MDNKETAKIQLSTESRILNTKNVLKEFIAKEDNNKTEEIFVSNKKKLTKKERMQRKIAKKTAKKSRKINRK